MLSTFKSPTLKLVESYCRNWAFMVFIVSTIFIIVFSNEAIRYWNPFFEKVSILLACLFPIGMVVFTQIRIWVRAKQVPGEIKWVLLVFMLGLISSFLSENIWATLKSVVLFSLSGPFIFIATKYLFGSTKNQDIFLWTVSITILPMACFGLYEFNYNQSFSGGIHLFSENPLPAGALLLLLSACPMVLLAREKSAFLKIIPILSLISTITLIILLSKKGPVVGLFITFLFIVIFVNFRHIVFLLVFFLLVLLVFCFSSSTFNKYGNLMGLQYTTPALLEKKNSGQKKPAPPEKENTYLGSFQVDKPPNFRNSIVLRLQNYFFAFHLFKNNPFLGVGFKTNLAQHLDGYHLKFHEDEIAERTRQDVIDEGIKKAKRVKKELLAESFKTGLKTHENAFEFYNRQDDGLYVPNRSGFNFSGDFTIECWFFSSLEGGDHRLFSHFGDTGEGGYLGGYGIRNIFSVSRNLNGDNVGLVYTPIPTPNVWHHYAYTRSGAVYRLFIDGKEEDSKEEAKVDDLTMDVPLIIGAQDRGKYVWSGLIDDYRITSGKALYTTSFTPTRSTNVDNYFINPKEFLRKPGPSLDKYRETPASEFELQHRNYFKSQYRSYIENSNTFENIVVAFLIELGGVFSITYFGGLIYFILIYLKKSHSPSPQKTTVLNITSVLVGFIFISLTFDTLRFPQLNWMFHTLLGLMACSFNECKAP